MPASPIVPSIVVAACVAAAAGCEVNPSAPDAQITLKQVAIDSCVNLTGVFQTTLIVVVPTARPNMVVRFEGNPALVLTVRDGRFASNVFASGLPAITNVGSFSVTGGFVIFGERPLMPRLATSTQQFGCTVSNGLFVFENGNALFDFGSGTFEPATVRTTLARR